jgi:hypothetical protein
MISKNFLIIDWPDSQIITELENYEENAFMLKDNANFINPTYAVNAEWWEKNTSQKE